MLAKAGTQFLANFNKSKNLDFRFRGNVGGSREEEEAGLGRNLGETLVKREGENVL